MTATSLPPVESSHDDQPTHGHNAAATLSGSLIRCHTGRFRKADSPARYRSATTIETLRPMSVTGELSTSGQVPALVHAPVDEGAVVTAPVDVADLRRCLAANPADDDLRLRLARSLLDAGDTTSAAVQVSLVLQQQPDRPEAVALLQATMMATLSTLRPPAGTARVTAF